MHAYFGGMNRLPFLLPEHTKCICLLGVMWQEQFVSFSRCGSQMRKHTRKASSTSPLANDFFFGYFTWQLKNTQKKAVMPHRRLIYTAIKRLSHNFKS